MSDHAASCEIYAPDKRKCNCVTTNARVEAMATELVKELWMEGYRRGRVDEISCPHHDAETAWSAGHTSDPEYHEFVFELSAKGLEIAEKQNRVVAQQMREAFESLRPALAAFGCTSDRMEKAIAAYDALQT